MTTSQTRKPQNHGPKLREGDTGIEKLCTACDEWWPADGEFFYADPEGVAGLFYTCKACYQDRYKTRRDARRKAKSAT